MLQSMEAERYRSVRSLKTRLFSHKASNLFVMPEEFVQAAPADIDVGACPVHMVTRRCDQCAGSH